MSNKEKKRNRWQHLDSGTIHFTQCLNKALKTNFVDALPTTW